MIIIEVNEGDETLNDIKTISEYFLEHEELLPLLKQDHIDLLEEIVKPTFAPDGDEAEKRALWDRLLKELVITDKDDNKLHFFRDKKHNRLYFGNQEGYETIFELAEHEKSINVTKRIS